MRATEFIVEYKTEEYNGLRFTTDIKNGQLIVRALDDWGTNELGHVVFNIGDQDELDPQDLEVDDRYQGQGIAKTMYDYVKTLGYEIHRSWDQTPAGAGFWNKHRGEEERVWEAFDQPYKSKWETSEYGDVDASTKLPDGTYLNIMFNQEYDGEGNEVIQVEFHRNNSQEVTGEGDAQRIFATVLATIQKYIKKYKPQNLIFSASKEVDPGQNSESRAKLYNRLVQRYASSWGYQSQHSDDGDAVRYQLTRTVAVAEDISRRGFLQGAGAAAALGATGVAQAKVNTAPKPVATNPSAELLLKWAKKFITDPAELAAFMSQCAHESDNFKAMEEYGSPERFARKYDIQHNPAKAKQLGNTQPGDGIKYRGRGYIQLTGKYNYQKAGEWISKFIGHPVDFVKQPDLVATPTAAALSSLWYWKTFVRPRTKSFANTKQVTKNINPGLKGQANREQKARDWQAALNVKPIKPGKPIKVAAR